MVHILIPKTVNTDTTVVDDKTGYYMTISNGSGYAFLSKLFAIGTVLCREELIYLPINFKHRKEYDQLFDQQHYKGIAIVNYCSTQISAKDLALALKTKIYTETDISKDCADSFSYTPKWQSKEKLTVKKADPV